MDPLSNLPRQEQQPEAHNAPASALRDAEPGHAPEPPAAPSMSEAHARPHLLQALPPPAPADTIHSSVPTLAIGGKRSAADAGLEADPDADAKRVKLGHPGEEATGAMPEPPDPVAGRKRSALDAGLDEDAQPASKRMRLDEPGRLQNHGQAMMADDEPPAQDRVPEEAAGAGDALNVQEQAVQRLKEMSINLP